jgi:hypothetical protein
MFWFFLAISSLVTFCGLKYAFERDNRNLYVATSIKKTADDQDQTLYRGDSSTPDV